MSDWTVAQIYWKDDFGGDQDATISFLNTSSPLGFPSKVGKVESWQQNHGNTNWKSLETWFLLPHPTAINLHFFRPKRSSTCWRTRCGGSMTSLLLTLNGRWMGISISRSSTNLPTPKKWGCWISLQPLLWHCNLIKAELFSRKALKRWKNGNLEFAFERTFFGEKQLVVWKQQFLLQSSLSWVHVPSMVPLGPFGLAGSAAVAGESPMLNAHVGNGWNWLISWPYSFWVPFFCFLRGRLRLTLNIMFVLGLPIVPLQLDFYIFLLPSTSIDFWVVSNQLSVAVPVYHEPQRMNCKTWVFLKLQPRDSFRNFVDYSFPLKISVLLLKYNRHASNMDVTKSDCESLQTSIGAFFLKFPQNITVNSSVTFEL